MTAPVFHTVMDAIGNTPMHEVTNMDTGKCRLFLKLENQNPGGSIKDRIGKTMIEAAEKSGELKPGGTIIEATAGNTGLGLALTAAQKGYKLIIVLPDKMAQEKIFHLRALGATVLLTRSDVGKGHAEYYQDMAERLAAENGYFYVNQFGNPANPFAHETTTGPEIRDQLASIDLEIDAMVCGVGSAGTITGLANYFKETAPDADMVLADPEGSILTHYVKTGQVSNEVGSWQVEGIGEDFLPPISDFSRVKHAYTIADKLAFETARELLLKEGILAGSSSGTLIAAALEYCREQTEAKNVVTFVCDSGNKYLSKMYNDFWMLDNGHISRPKTGDLRDLVTRKYAVQQIVTLPATETLSAAYGKMKLYDISQLPVMEGEKVVGLVDEEDLLIQVFKNQGSFDGNIADIMTTDPITIDSQEPIERLLQVFKGGMTVLITHNGKFEGLVTKIDLLNHLQLSNR
jgi:cystathionine beta-synthase